MYTGLRKHDKQRHLDNGSDHAKDAVSMFVYEEIAMTLLREGRYKEVA